MMKRRILAIIFSMFFVACALVACGEKESTNNTTPPTTEENGGNEETGNNGENGGNQTVEPSDPEGFIIYVDIPYSCCKVSSNSVEVQKGATSITLPTPECEHDEHTFKYWKYNGEKLGKVADIWSRIEDGAKTATIKAYCSRNWTNNH